MEVWELIAISGLVGGLVGLILGSQVDKGAPGFFLGFFLGPFGWIIVFLLPRDQESRDSNDGVNKGVSKTPKKITPRPKRDLKSDAYKLWLRKTYNIKKNDFFKKYECEGKLFDSLEDALTDADQRDCAK